MKFPFLKRKSAIVTPTSSGATIFFFPGFSGKITNTRQLIRAAYLENATAHACIRLISQSIAQLEPYLLRTKGEKQEEIRQHEILDLLARPARDVNSTPAFFEILVKYFLLAGNCYVVKARLGKGRPRQLFFLAPDLVRVEHDGREITKYLYQSGNFSAEYAPEDVIHVKEFNPLNPFVGLSRLQAASGPLGIENEAIVWNAGLLEHGGRLSGVFTPLEPITEIQRQRLEQAFANFSGYANTGKTPVLPFNMKYEELGINPKDLDFINAIKLASRKICSVFGVPAELLGDAEAKTYSNYQEARKSFWLETIIPMARNIYAELNVQLVEAEWGNEGLRLMFDVDQIDAIQENRREKYAYLNDAWWLSLNERREATGYDSVPGGEYLFVPSSLIPTMRTDREVSRDEEKRQAGRIARRLIVPANQKAQRWKEKEQRDLLWNNFVFLVKKKEKTFLPIVEKYLAGQVGRAISEIRKAGSVPVANSVRILDVEDEAKKFLDATRDVYLYHVGHGIRAGQKAAKGQLYELEEKFRPEELTVEEKEYLENLILNSGTKITRTTLEEIRAMLLLAEAENQTVEKLAEAIRDKFEIFTPWRARMIARTESAKTENWAELEGYRRDEFVGLKGWLSARVPNSRQEHIDAETYYEANPIALDEPFLVGGEQLMYPGDPAGSPANVINCLCSLYPRTRE